MATSIMKLSTAESMTSTMRQAAKTSNVKSRRSSKYFPPSNKESLSSHTSLLDVLRAAGPQILGAQEPVQARRPSTGRNMTSSVKSLSSSTSSTASGSMSKPIRIIANSSQHAQEEEKEECLSSSAELERFYDQATWRMYVLIQSARLANEHQHHAAPAHGRVPMTSHSHAHYSTTQDAHLQRQRNSSTSIDRRTTQRFEEEEKDGIFDFEL